MTVACGIIALAALPVALLANESRPRTTGKLHRPSRFLFRFLVAFGLWGGVVGAFNPFTNVYFSRYLGVATSKLGDFFAVAQLIQAGIVLLTPILLRRTGLIRGIMFTQLATAVALACLAGGHSVLQAEIMYCAYMAAQHMGDPAIQSLLMGRVADNLRSEATAMSFLVLSLAQACASAAGGLAFARFHYSQVLVSVAVAATAAALLFRWLCTQPETVPQRS